MSKATKADTPQKVNYNDAVAESKKYFDGDDLAATVWVSKYALKDSFGNIYEKSPREMHERIASEIERIEQKYPNPLPKEEVFALLDHFRYVIPQGGPMTGIGNNFQVASLSNCFVIGHKNPADSYGGIFRMDEEQVQLMKRRGGVGHDLSHIRPTGSPVLNSALTSTGIVPFMERYSNSTREVAQDGRRGALMLSLSIKHPDAERFIDAKVDTGKVTGANVSIKIDDDFMRAALAGKKYHQQFPIKSDNPKYEQDIDARKLWEKIIHNAWKSAEPGVLFWDTIIRESIPDCYADEGFVTVSANPCSELTLCPYVSCRLLAMNLLSYVDNPFKADAKFNFDKFRDHVYKAMHMMDDIIDLELEKVEQIIGKIAADPEDLDVRRVELETEQRKLYLAAVVDAREKLRAAKPEDKMTVFAVLMRLREICCDPRLVADYWDGGSAKLEACMELVTAAVEGGHRILLFSQFTSMLELLAKRLDEAGVSHFTLQGSTPKPVRAELVRRFNSGEADVFLISLRAGGTGLNLTAADIVIHYDPWWNVAAQNQATDRAYRIGQRNPVQVYKLIAQDTIEEKIVELQQAKQSLADTVTGSADGAILSMKPEELLQLRGEEA